MVIRVSDLGITRYNSYNGDNSKVGYVSINERLNKKPVEKVDSVASSTSHQRSVAKEAGEKFVSASTPAYTIDFTSQGMSALKSFKAAREYLEQMEELEQKKAASPEPAETEKNVQDTSTAYEKSYVRGTDNKNDQKSRSPFAEKINKTTDTRNSGINKINSSYKQTQAVKAYDYQMSLGHERTSFAKPKTVQGISK